MYKTKNLIYQDIVRPIAIQVVAFTQEIAFPILKRVLNLKLFLKKGLATKFKQQINLLGKIPEDAPLQVLVRPWPYCQVVLTNNHISGSNNRFRKKINRAPLLKFC